MELQLAVRDDALERAAAVDDDTYPDGIGEFLSQFRFEDAVERHETVHDLRGIEIGEEFLQRFLAEAAHDGALLYVLLHAAALLRLRHLQQLDEPPLARAVVVCAAPGFEESLAPMAPVIAEELNVKAVEFASDESRFVTLSAKANFKVLGKKLGPRMKAAAAAIAALPAADIAKLQAGSSVSLVLRDGGDAVDLLPEDVLVQRSENAGLTVANDGDLTVALDPKLTPDLVAEGIAREFVSHVQTLRKEAGLDVADRIRLSVSTDAEAAAALRAHAEFVKGETLALDLAVGEGGSDDVDLNGHPAAISLAKA